jgi:hypothetical protein
MSKFILVRSGQSTTLERKTPLVGEPCLQGDSVKTDENKNELPRNKQMLQHVVLQRTIMRHPRNSRAPRAFRIPKLPPDLDLGRIQVLSQRLRFVADSNVTQGTATLVSVFGAIGGICTVANSSVQGWASSFRLRRLTIWPAASGEATIFWGTGNAGTFGQPDEVHDSSIPTGITIDQPVSSTPPKNSWAAQWHDSTESVATAPILYFTITEGSVLDLELDFTLSAALNGYQWSATTASLKAIYYGYLDGSTTHLLKPLGRPSTF